MLRNPFSNWNTGIEQSYVKREIAFHVAFATLVRSCECNVSVLGEYYRDVGAAEATGIRNAPIKRSMLWSSGRGVLYMELVAQRSKADSKWTFLINEAALHVFSVQVASIRNKLLFI